MAPPAPSQCQVAGCNYKTKENLPTHEAVHNDLHLHVQMVHILSTSATPPNAARMRWKPLEGYKQAAVDSSDEVRDQLENLMEMKEEKLKEIDVKKGKVEFCNTKDKPKYDEIFYNLAPDEGKLSGTKAKDWKQLALSLPALDTIIMDDVSQESLDLVKTFTNLRHLAIRAKCSVSMCDSIVCQPSQLTHLSMCNVHFRGGPTFKTLISQYKNLTSLIYHQNTRDPFEAFYSIIGNLPKLKHLSCSMNLEPWMDYCNIPSIEGGIETAHPCGLSLFCLARWFCLVGFVTYYAQPS